MGTVEFDKRRMSPCLLFPGCEVNWRVGLFLLSVHRIQKKKGELERTSLEFGFIYKDMFGSEPHAYRVCIRTVVFVSVTMKKVNII